jgi:CheY-like chemotaxis protein
VTIAIVGGALLALTRERDIQGGADLELTGQKEKFFPDCVASRSLVLSVHLRMAADPWPSLRGIHAFVVDDNEDSRRLLEQALRYCGALVTVFETPAAALEALNEYLPTLIVSDISLPGMTGFDFVRRLRARPVDKGGLIPAIAITAFYEEFLAGAARNAGFDAYLTKPINFETLCGLVEHIAGLKRREDDTAA